VDYNSKFSYLREYYLPYKFKLLLRGSRDGFTPKTFHTICDNRLNTVTFIKVKETGEILGGHNPSVWKSSDDWSQSYYSFIFSFKSKGDIKDPILSRVKNTHKSLLYNFCNGPTFGGYDLRISYNGDYYRYGMDEEPFNYNICKQTNYEKRIRNTEDKFHVEDYEVFQIINK
jgi:hypothetical protein